MRNEVRIPNSIVDDLTLNDDALIPLVYLLSERKKIDESMIVSPRIISVWLSLPEATKDELLETEKITRGLRYLNVHGLITVEWDYKGCAGLHLVEFNEPLNNSDSFLKVRCCKLNLDKVRDLISYRNEIVGYLGKLMRFLMVLTRKSFKAQGMPTQFEGLFVVDSFVDLGRRVYRVGIESRSIKRKLKDKMKVRVNDLERLGLIHVLNFDEPVIPVGRFAFKRFYALTDDAELIEAFNLWMVANYGVSVRKAERRRQEEERVPEPKKEKLHTPVFKMRDELYQGYPAKMIKGYTGKDEYINELKRQMIEDWTQ